MNVNGKLTILICLLVVSCSAAAQDRRGEATVSALELSVDCDVLDDHVAMVAHATNTSADTLRFYGMFAVRRTDEFIDGRRAFQAYADSLNAEYGTYDNWPSESKPTQFHPVFFTGGHGIGTQVPWADYAKELLPGEALVFRTLFQYDPVWTARFPRKVSMTFRLLAVDQPVDGALDWPAHAERGLVRVESELR